MIFEEMFICLEEVYFDNNSQLINPHKFFHRLTRTARWPDTWHVDRTGSGSDLGQGDSACCRRRRGRRRGGSVSWVTRVQGMQGFLAAVSSHSVHSVYPRRITRRLSTWYRTRPKYSDYKEIFLSQMSSDRYRSLSYLR